MLSELGELGLGLLWARKMHWRYDSENCHSAEGHNGCSDNLVARLTTAESHE